MTFRVAVIENEPTLVRTLRRVLCRRGYLVTHLAIDAAQLEVLIDEAETSADPFGLASLFWDGRARVPSDCSVVISDYYLNGHNLMEVLPDLRAVAGVVAITAASSVDLVRQLVRAGIDGYVRKPYDGTEELVAAVELAYRAHRTRETGRALVARIEAATSLRTTWEQVELTRALADLSRLRREEW